VLRTTASAVRTVTDWRVRSWRSAHLTGAGAVNADAAAMPARTRTFFCIAVDFHKKVVRLYLCEQKHRYKFYRYLSNWNNLETQSVSKIRRAYERDWRARGLGAEPPGLLHPGQRQSPKFDAGPSNFWCEAKRAWNTGHIPNFPFSVQIPFTLKTPVQVVFFLHENEAYRRYQWGWQHATKRLRWR